MPHRTLLLLLVFPGTFALIAGCREKGDSPPVLLQMDYWEDGGTTCVVFRDHGRTTSFCFDGRLHSDTPYQIYLGYPGDAAAVPRNSDAEAELLEMVYRYLNSKYREERLQQLTQTPVMQLAEQERNDVLLWRAATTCDRQ